MKKLLVYFILIFIFSINIKAQNINCYKNNDLKISKKIMALLFNDYKKETNTKNKIIIFDYYFFDSILVARLQETDNILWILARQPDCYTIIDSNIIYLYSYKYFDNKPTIWLDSLFIYTKNVLNKNKLNIDWTQKKITNTENYIITKDGEYDPPIIEYLCIKDSVIKKSYKPKLLFFDLHNVPLLFNNILKAP